MLITQYYPMCREIMAPGESPLSLYSKIANQQNNFLFESVEGGDRWAQYSIIGFGCIDTIKISGKKLKQLLMEVGISSKLKTPFKQLKKLFQRIARLKLKIYQDFMVAT